MYCGSNVYYYLYNQLLNVCFLSFETFYILSKYIEAFTMYYYLNVTSVVADSDFEFEEKNTTKNVLKNFHKLFVKSFK